MQGSSDIGTAIIYAVVSVGLLTIAYYAGTSRHSVDYHLEKRISWWWKVAEVLRPEPAQPAQPALAPVPVPTLERISA